MFQFEDDDDNFDFDIDFDSLESYNKSKDVISLSNNNTNVSLPQKENLLPPSKACELMSTTPPKAIINQADNFPSSSASTQPARPRPAAVKRTLPEFPPPQLQPEPKLRYIRKFPGPAGIIVLDPNKDPLSENDMKKYSLEETSDICDVDWAKVLEKLDLCSLELDNVRRISSIKQKLSHSRTLTSRLSFLIVSVKEIEPSTQDASCVLADMSGELMGSVHQPVVDHYGKFLKKGSTLLLRNVALLLPKGSRSKIYLNITMRSLLAIHSPEHYVTRLQPFSLVDIKQWIAEDSVRFSDNGTEYRQQRDLFPPNVFFRKHSENATAVSANDVEAQFMSGVDDDLFDQFELN